MGELQRATGLTAEPAAAPGSAVAVASQRGPAELSRDEFRHSLEARKAYAATLANSGLLPKAYIRNPANVLFALEYGQTLGITTVAAMMGIHVIDGKPCASSGLISGLVRRAGHRLRVSGDEKTATCIIIRADDPDYKFEFTWTIARAQQAGLTGKQVWKNYPAAMLMARAITEAARAACQDVLYGLAYTPEELGADALDTDLPPGEIMVANSAEAGPRLNAETMAELNSHLERLEVSDPAIKLDICCLLIDRRGEVLRAVDLAQDEAEFIISELEGCENNAALNTLIAERSAIA